ncbi:MAG: hypothetical protein COU69_02525 [Candidatus Pacebacteria bacterium CG10_big_fil_rev_8_21_14_0_10_56_10]|nr:MAG: hypothetical protein COU69_02525 [Candidatus Pacebacteria bacterium CG10_big_fil_rev_8_21_14_0_10_56_10]
MGITRTKLTIVFAIIVAVLIVTGTVVRQLFPGELEIAVTPTVTTNFNQTSSTFGDVRYVGQDPSFPERLAVFATQRAVVQNDVVTSLREQFELTPLARVENIWQGPDGELLAIDQSTGQVSLSVRPATPIKDPLKNQAQLIDDSRRHLETYFSNLPLEALTERLVFTGEQEGFGSVEFFDATGLLVPYGYRLAGWPLVQDLSGQAVVVVGVDRDGELVSLSFTDQLLGFSAVGEKTLIDIDQAVGNIKANQALVGRASPEKNVGIDIDAITSASLESVSLEYRFDPANNLTYPFYRFSGRGTNSRGDQLELEVVTPAVGIN